jgi:hypothetical protein
MMTTMPIAMLMITATTMTTMMLTWHLTAAMILCANHAGTSAIVRIAITNVQTTSAVLIDGTAQHLPGRGSINGAFMHGHCNVALSKVRNRESPDPTTGKRAARTTNIVCRKSSTCNHN